MHQYQSELLFHLAAFVATLQALGNTDPDGFPI